jgi:hypothetical protein
MPVVKVLNAAGYYTAPTQYNVAVALTKAIINEDPTSQNYLTQDLDNVYSNADRRTYPLSSYSYMIIPTSPKDAKLNAAKAQTLADFLYYSICPGQAEVGPTGYSPLPINLVTAGFSQIAKLKTAQPSIDLSNQNVTTCNNPTFIKGHPTENHLAVIAPQPPSCDQQGQGPCGAGVGLTNGNPTKSGAPASSSGPSAGSGQGSTPGSSASPSTSGPPGSSPSPGSSTSVPGSTQTSPSAVVVQPSGGGGVGTPVAPVTNADVTGVATNLAAYPENNKSPAYGSLAAFVVLLGLAGPAAFLGLRRRRSRTVKDVS